MNLVMTSELPAADTLNVCTYNLYYNGHLDERDRLATANAMVRCHCDIISVQECNPDWEEYLRSHEELVQTYPHMTFLHHRWSMGGKAILSKHLVMEYDETRDVSEEVFNGWYPAWRTEVRVSDGCRVELIHVHLRANFPSNLWVLQRQRLKEIETHWDRLIPKNNNPCRATIVLGDFNCGSNSLCTRFLEDKGFVSVLSKKHRHRTWHWKCLSAHFDHIFVRHDQFTVEDGRALSGKGGSDHFPVVGRLKWKDGAKE